MVSLEFGIINTLDTKRNTARVLLPELDNKITSPLHILIPASATDKEFYTYREGTLVACLIIRELKRGNIKGVILGTWFSEKHISPEGASVEKKIWEYPGGRIELDKDNGELKIDLVKKIKITTPLIEIDANIKLKGNIEQEGKINSTDVIDSKTDVTAKGVSLATHPHPYKDDGKPAITEPPTSSMKTYLTKGFQNIAGWLK